MVNTLTDRQMEVFALKRNGLSNREIAQRLDTTEPNISQILKRVREKIQSVEDTVNLLIQLGEFKEGPRISLSERGRIPAQLPSWVKPVEPFRPHRNEEYVVIGENIALITEFLQPNIWTIWGEGIAEKYVTILESDMKYEMSEEE